MADNLFYQLIIILAGFTQGLTGFGSALIMLPLLTFLMDIKMVVPLVILHGICINLILFCRVQKHIEWERIRILFAATVPGIVCGVYILKAMSTDFLELMVGFLLIIFPLLLLLKNFPEREVAMGWAWPAGFISGVLSGSINAGGPPIIVYVTMQPWEKFPMKSTMVGLFLLTSVTTGSAHALGGLISWEIFMLFAAGLPALIGGVLVGSYLFDRVDSGLYRKTLNILLVVLGMFMAGKVIMN